ncbi:cupin [Streptomyces sp. NBC_00120]|uniref:cupin n=1 Tax=Streptomyces sp. NBC_00120 TaxID=2975660 RepID=UPI002258E384|nr:cupin [Streptomyces sp. NBC_00120]MCX5326283.1 cupin [Streptomyces sp. NBC_00120]
MAADMRVYVEAIGGTPLPHGILGAPCTQVRDVSDEHELLGVEWLALGCCPVESWKNPCDDDESPGDVSGGAAEKEFCRPEIEHASPITLYAGTECATIGWTYEEARRHAEATLALGEQRGLESAFWRTTLTADAVDVTPEAGPVSLGQGVAALEGCLAEAYGGVGTLHVPAGAAALLGCCAIVSEDAASGALRTLAGNCVVIGAGYSAENTGPGGTPADPGTAWLYITGPLSIRRGPSSTIPDRAGSSVNIRTNDRRVLVERTYVVGTTCTVCAVNVTLS